MILEVEGRRAHDKYIDVDAGDGQAKPHCLRQACAQHQPARAKGFLVDPQSLTFAVWLGLAVSALVWANLALWHTRRVLARISQDHCVTQVRFMQAPTVAPVKLIQAPAGQPVSPARAS